MKVAYFRYEEWEKDYLENHEGLKKIGAEITFFSGPLVPDSMPEQKDFDVISVFVGSRVDAGVIERFPNLKLIATRSTGYDHIDLASAKARDITVANVPVYGANTVAEHAFALLLCLSKRIFDGYEQVREVGDFDPHKLRGFDLAGRTLGVIGTGNIGRHAVSMGKGFGMTVIAHDAFPNEEYAKGVGLAYVSLDELLAKSDVITVHVPYLPATHHLINVENIKKLKKGAVIINTARGAVVETRALINALEDGTLSGAGLDVLEEEGIVKDELAFLASGKAGEHDMTTILANHVLIDHPNVIVTPHSAFNTQEALQRIIDTTIENIETFSRGEPTNVVKPK